MRHSATTAAVGDVRLVNKDSHKVSVTTHLTNPATAITMSLIVVAELSFFALFTVCTYRPSASGKSSVQCHSESIELLFWPTASRRFSVPDTVKKSYKFYAG